MIADADILPALARLLVEFSLPNVDVRVGQRARTLMLDSLGCAVAARDHPAVRKTAAAAANLSPGDVATGLGSGQRLGLLGAVLDSGAAIRALDFNDFYWGPGIGGHPSDLYAVAFALAEATDVSLRSMLEAVIAGYEVYLRLLDMLPGDGPFDHTTAMTMAGAALAGRLFRLDSTAMAHALAMAAVRGPALSAIRYGEICEAKAVAPAVAGISGLISAQLAAAGIGGPVASACGRFGIGVVVAPGADLRSLAAPAGFGTKIIDVTVKRFPCIGTAQTAVAAALDISRQVAQTGQRVERVDVRLADDGIVIHQTTQPYRRPTQRETADHSFFSLMALALVDGEVTPKQFAERRFFDPDIHAMSDRLFFECDLPGAGEGLLAARALATLSDGRQIAVAVDYAPGHCRNPLDHAGIADKFRSCAQAALGVARCGELIDRCLHGSDDRPVREITELLRRN